MGRVNSSLEDLESKNQGRGAVSLPWRNRRPKKNEMLCGCEKCRYWIREFNNEGFYYGKNRCGNPKFHKHMKENYKMDSRRWLLDKQYCQFCREFKTDEQVVVSIGTNNKQIESYVA